jgi:Electron transfer DM13
MNLSKLSPALLTTSLLATAALGFAAVNAQTMKPDTMKGVTQTAKLFSVGAPTSGNLEIVEQTDGSSLLRLKNFKTEAGPDLHVYLYEAAVPAKEVKNLKTAKYLDLGKVLAPFKGNLEYKIPASAKLSSFKSVIVWCDLAKVTFGGARLK